MSGGSFDYLHSELPLPPDGLVRMAEEAEAEGFTEGAKLLRQMLKHYAAISEDWSKAEEFMRAFEWWKSGDYGSEQVKEAEEGLAEP